MQADPVRLLGEGGMCQWVCARRAAGAARLPSGDTLGLQTSRRRSSPRPVLCRHSGGSRELREPDLGDKRMVAEAVLYKMPLSGAYFTGSSRA